jgi:hypothetical protein
MRIYMSKRKSSRKKDNDERATPTAEDKIKLQQKYERLIHENFKNWELFIKLFVLGFTTALLEGLGAIELLTPLAATFMLPGIAVLIFAVTIYAVHRYQLNKRDRVNVEMGQISREDLEGSLGEQCEKAVTRQFSPANPKIIKQRELKDAIRWYQEESFKRYSKLFLSFFIGALLFSTSILMSHTIGVALGMGLLGTIGGPLVLAIGFAVILSSYDAALAPKGSRFKAFKQHMLSNMLYFALSALIPLVSWAHLGKIFGVIAVAMVHTVFHGAADKLGEVGEPHYKTPPIAQNNLESALLKQKKPGREEKLGKQSSTFTTANASKGLSKGKGSAPGQQILEAEVPLDSGDKSPSGGSPNSSTTNPSHRRPLNLVPADSKSKKSTNNDEGEGEGEKRESSAP